MAADNIQARIDEIECELYAPGNYQVNVISGKGVDAAQQRRVTELAAELEKLRKRQTLEGSGLEIVGGRLSTGYIPRPEPQEPPSWRDEGHEYNPWRRAAEEFGWELE